MDLCDSLDAELPIFEQRFNVSRYVRSLRLSQTNGRVMDGSSRSKPNPEVCDVMYDASELLLNGFYYFVNARYDFDAKIWISPGLKFSANILR